MKVAIAIPCHLFIAPQMAQSLAGMFYALGERRISVIYRFLGNAVSTFGRNALVRWAIDNNATHILWIDTDSKFPPHALQKLLAANKPFIGANFALKDGSGASAASSSDTERLVPRKTGIEECKVLGFGLTLTRMDVLKAVGEPWFKESDDRDFPGDEVRFCELAAAKGFVPFVDHELSSLCGHMGLFEYKLGA